MTSFKDAEIGFIGAGVVGTALALVLQGRGYRVATVASRRANSAKALAARVPGCHVERDAQGVSDRCRLVFITTPDDVIAEVAARVRWHSGQGVVHCSGAESLEALKPVSEAGAIAGSFHPLQTFASIEQAIKAIPGSLFALEGEGALLEFLEDVVSALGGRSIRLKPGEKALYHASAVMACGGVVALLGAASQLWDRMGYAQGEGIKALLPLLRGTVDSLEKNGIPQALTGPYARGDMGTVEKHLNALEAKAPELLHLYCAIGLAQLPIALSKGGISERGAAQIKEQIYRYLK